MLLRILFRLILLLVVLTFLFSRAIRTQAYADTPSDLVEAVNQLRASYGLPPYTVNPILMAAAQAQSDYMAASGHVSHSGAGGSTVTQRLLALGYPLAGDLSLGGFRSENITSGSETMSAQEAVNRWTGDTLHLTTMISPDLTEIGAGVTVHNGRVYYVIDCARPTDSGIPQGGNLALPGATAISTLPPGVSGVIFPVIVSTPNAAGDVFHEVKAGQSLWQIAISYETRIEEIKRLNHLFGNEIYPGTKLLVRQVVPTSSTLPSITPSPTPQIASTQPWTATSPPATTVSSAAGNTVPAAIAIIVLALLGGGIVAWWGARRNHSNP